MKMNPPASSNSPTSRKKPRIMRHLIAVAPEMPSAISGATGEIQPHQQLIRGLQAGFPVPARAESVDAAKPALYKGANGGGRNPAAAVLCAAPSCEPVGLPSVASSQNTGKNTIASIKRLNGGSSTLTSQRLDRKSTR